MRRRGLVGGGAPALLALCVSGCFFELRGGYYPSMTSELADATGQTLARHEGDGFTVGASLGVFVDFYSVLVGISAPSTGGETPVSDGLLDGDLEMTGAVFRVDVDAPIHPWARGILRPRLTYATEQFVGGIFRLRDQPDHELTSEDASGSSHYLGFTIALPGSAMSVSAGPMFFHYADRSGPAAFLDPGRRNVQMTMPTNSATIRISQ